MFYVFFIIMHIYFYYCAVCINFKNQVIKNKDEKRWYLFKLLWMKIIIQTINKKFKYNNSNV